MAKSNPGEFSLDYGCYLADWFFELNKARGALIISGMGGGAVIPKPIPYSEIESWGNLGRHFLQPWEVETLRRMDRSFIEAFHGTSESKSDQEIGDYCNGRDIDACRLKFREQLADVCRTCPN